MTDPAQPLRPATADELKQALGQALRFDGRKAFKVSGEMMAKRTGAHLAECLRRSGFVVMKAAPAPAHRAPGSEDAGRYDAVDARFTDLMGSAHDLSKIAR